MENIDILHKAIEIETKHQTGNHWSAMVDFTRMANRHRFFLINLDKGKIEYSWWTSHGSGSGPKDKCLTYSNVPNSLKSSKGLMKTGDTYIGKHGYSLRLHGLEKGVNDYVFDRHIVIHPSDYVTKSYITHNTFPGRSWGCITLDPDESKEIINRLKGGSLIYTIT